MIRLYLLPCWLPSYGPWEAASPNLVHLLSASQCRFRDSILDLPCPTPNCDVVLGPGSTATLPTQQAVSFPPLAPWASLRHLILAQPSTLASLPPCVPLPCPTDAEQRQHQELTVPGGERSERACLTHQPRKWASWVGCTNLSHLTTPPSFNAFSLLSLTKLSIYCFKEPIDFRQKHP